jgi:diguanylate cyclase (GGDEF)-like protein
MAIMQEGRLVKPNVVEVTGALLKATQLAASKRQVPDSTDVTSVDIRDVPALRGLQFQTSAKLLDCTPWAKCHQTDNADQMTSAAMNSARSSPLAKSRGRALVAESDPDVRLLMGVWLEGWGYQVVMAKDGAEAWNVLQQKRPPELLIMDWMMPGIQGVELTRRLRDEQRDYYHYILLISGKSGKKDIGHALELGADDYLIKPFGKNELRARLTVASRILSLQDDLIRTREGLLDRATKDSLTGVWNRVAVMDLFQRELDRASRVNTQTGLLILDLDNFKTVNDTYGHLTGDFVLKEAAARLKHAVRSYDLVGRYGGEEFLMVFPECNRDQLCRIAENIRVAVATRPVLFGAFEIPITISIGAVTVNSVERSTGNMIGVADVALYKAKTAGRNRAVYCERSWNDIQQSNDTHHALCSKCDRGLAEVCVVQPQGPINLNQEVKIGMIREGAGLIQIPFRSAPSMQKSISCR